MASGQTLDDQLQVLDVHIVDILSHLEALLRHSHSIQRVLLQMRSAAPPPRPAPPAAVLGSLLDHTGDMHHECEMLVEIIDDMTLGIDAVGALVENREATSDSPAGERQGKS